VTLQETSGYFIHTPPIETTSETGNGKICIDTAPRHHGNDAEWRHGLRGAALIMAEIGLRGNWTKIELHWNLFGIGFAVAYFLLGHSRN